MESISRPGSRLFSPIIFPVIFSRCHHQAAPSSQALSTQAILYLISGVEKPVKFTAHVVQPITTFRLVYPNLNFLRLPRDFLPTNHRGFTITWSGTANQGVARRSYVEQSQSGLLEVLLVDADWSDLKCRLTNALTRGTRQCCDCFLSAI